MKNFGYYAFDDTSKNRLALNRCSRESDAHPLMVNCAGHFASRFPFMTDNKDGRLDYYIIYVNSGTLTFFNHEKSTGAGSGSLVLIPPREGYKYSYCGGEELGYYWLHFTGSSVKQRLDEYSIDSFPKIYSCGETNRIVQRFQSIFDAFEKQDRFRDRELSALLDRMLIAIARSLSVAGNSSDAMSKSVRYINANYSSDIKIPDLAAMEHLSTSRYNFLFKERFGVSPKKYILKLRMSWARELLLSTDLPIKQIGIMCGYEDSHFFSKCFKSFFGIPPTQCRVEQ